jgi:hypothetical protein
MSSAACQTASICAQVVFWGEVLNANRINPTVVQIVESWRDACEYANPTLSKALPIDVSITLLAAGLIFLLALVLGVWKYRQVLVSEDHRAHPYVDIAHRAALLYSFATLLIAVFVQFSAWPVWVNLTAAMVLVFFLRRSDSQLHRTRAEARHRQSVRPFPTGGCGWGWRRSSSARSAASGCCSPGSSPGSGSSRRGTLEIWTR